MSNIDIANDARRISLLFKYRVLTGKEVIAWADSVIIKMDSLPDSLLELSLTAPEKTGDIISLLHKLSSGSDFWAAFRSALPQIRDFIVIHPDRAENIANHLFRDACYDSNKVPEDLHFMFRFEDAFSLAKGDIFGKQKAVYRDFLEAMNKAILAT